MKAVGTKAPFATLNLKMTLVAYITFLFATRQVIRLCHGSCGVALARTTGTTTVALAVAPSRSTVRSGTERVTSQTSKVPTSRAATTHLSPTALNGLPGRDTTTQWVHGGENTSIHYCLMELNKNCRLDPYFYGKST